MTLFLEGFHSGVILARVVREIRQDDDSSRYLVSHPIIFFRRAFKSRGLLLMACSLPSTVKILSDSVTVISGLSMLHVFADERS